MKMKGQIDSVYPPVEETKKKKKSKKSDKKATKKKAHKKSSKTEKDVIKAKKTNHTSSDPIKETSSSESSQTTKAPLEQNERSTQENQPASLATKQEPSQNDLTKLPIARASKNSQPLVATNKRQTMRRITRQLSNGEISQGEALKTLRIQVMGLKQEDFANLVGVSRKTLSENENDKGNYTADIINKLFSPFDLKVGLVPC